MKTSEVLARLGGDVVPLQRRAKIVRKRSGFPGRMRSFWDATPWGGGHVAADGGPGGVVLPGGFLLDLRTGDVRRDARFDDAGGLRGPGAASSRRSLFIFGGLLLGGWLLLKGRRASARESPGSSPPPGAPAAGGSEGDMIGASGTWRTVAAGESLAAIAQAAYGDRRWWPFLWDLNRAAIGASPDGLRVGTRIGVPVPGLLPTAQREAHFARAEEHRRIWAAWAAAGNRGLPPLPASVLDAPGGAS